MDPIPAPSHSNQNLRSENLIPRPASPVSRPGNVPENTDSENINIQVPPKGMLDSSKVSLNSNGTLKMDKNIKVDLDLNSAPTPPGMNAAPKSFYQSAQLVQNSPVPPQLPKDESKNHDAYKLSSGEVQGPKPPLVSNKSHRLVFILVSGVAIGALAVGGYYFMQNRNSGSPVVIASPSPTPETVIDPALDSDADTIPDLVENAIGTDPDKMDSDGDSYNDAAEIKSGYSPIIAGSAGKYTPEDLQALKDKIRMADEGFYAVLFGAENGDVNKETKN